jgi:RNA polymerase sigma-70 factor (ECF subfamily)
MPTPEWLADRFGGAPSAYALGGLPHARLGERGRGCRPGSVDSTRPNGRQYVENLRAWLTTVVARVCLDILRTRTSRREAPLDVYCPIR